MEELSIVEKLNLMYNYKFDTDNFFGELCKYYQYRSSKFELFLRFHNFPSVKAPGWPAEYVSHDFIPYSLQKEVKIEMKTIVGSYYFSVPVYILHSSNSYSDTTYWGDIMKRVIVEEDLSLGLEL